MLRTSAVIFGSFAIMVAGLVPETYGVRSDAESQTQAPAPLPSVDLPPELNRVLGDYERHWKASDGTALSELFTDDGFINRGGWIRSSIGSDAAERSDRVCA